MSVTYQYTDILGHWIPSFILISSLHGRTDHCYDMHVHRDITRRITTHRCSTGTLIDHCTDYCISCLHITVTHACISCLHITVTHACHVLYPCHTCLYGLSIFLSYGSPCILFVLLFHVPVFMLYDCFLLLIWIVP